MMMDLFVQQRAAVTGALQKINKARTAAYRGQLEARNRT